MKNMQATAQAEKRASVRLWSTDEEIFRQLARYTLLQVSDLASLLNRNIVSLRARLLKLDRAGYVRRMTPPFERVCPGIMPDERAVMLGPYGVSQSRRLGFLPPDYRYLRRESNLLIPHDLGISRFHRALDTAFEIQWEQRRSKLQDRIEVDGEQSAVVPDAFLTVHGKWSYFLEWENSDPNSRNGESSLVAKIKAYTAYAKGRLQEKYGIRLARTLVVLPSPIRVTNFLHAHRELLKTTQFMFADQESALHVTDAVWLTGKDSTALPLFVAQ